MRSGTRKLAAAAAALMMATGLLLASTGAATAAPRTYKLEFCNYGSDFNAYLLFVDRGLATTTVKRPGECFKDSALPSIGTERFRVVGEKKVDGKLVTNVSRTLTADGYNTYVETFGKFPAGFAPLAARIS
ncbi:hypothetical protein [Actinosynnema sp. NPDC020468]|uniref:hypothetical protein n=1 Tax=Actinosynnema sp. NPDC020468 TaxID=3154488 RepID=UPI0033D813BD